MKRTVLLVALLVASIITRAHAYELATHGAVTWHAYQKSVLGKDPKLWTHLGIDSTKDNAFGNTYYDLSETQPRERSASDFEKKIIEVDPAGLGTRHLTTVGWLLRGAIREDDYRTRVIDLGVVKCTITAPNPQEENLDRPINHFYDPFHDRPLAIPGARKAPDWALGTSDVFRNPNTPEPGRPNHFTVFDAREAMYRALTGRNKENQEIAKTKADRDKYWATTFRALGDNVHLIEDMAQPQHTRDDRHFGECIPHVTGHKSVYEEYVESRATGREFTTPKGQKIPATPLNYIGDNAPGGYPIPRFTDYASFFTTRQRHPREDQISARQDLADYSNRGFFSAGTNLGKSDYPYPIQTPGVYGRETLNRNWADEPLDGTVTLLTNTVSDSMTGETAANVPLTTFGVFDQFLEDRNLLADYTLTRPNYDAQANLLIPRAVAYSAGLIDYFFRGKLDIRDASYSDTGIVLRIKNAIDPNAQPYWRDEHLVPGAVLVATLQYQVPDATDPSGYTTRQFTSNAVIGMPRLPHIAFTNGANADIPTSRRIT